jgi:hypothetical protein
MFEDNNGTWVGPSYGSYTEVPGNGVYDYEIYSNQTIKGKISFAFINTCLSACINDTVGGQNAAQGFVSGRARGMPFALTNRTVKGTSEQGFTTALHMSKNGYSNPDDGSQCYIGFPFGSAALA